jgi:hypothetical protein
MYLNPFVIYIVLLKKENTHTQKDSFSLYCLLLLHFIFELIFLLKFLYANLWQMFNIEINTGYGNDSILCYDIILTHLFKLTNYATILFRNDTDFRYSIGELLRYNFF